MSVTPMPGLCTKCGENPIAMVNGDQKWCWKCLGIDPMTVPKEQGGQGVVLPEEKKNDESNVLHIDFPRLKAKVKPSWVAGVDVIFTDNTGAKRLVRTTNSEQTGIASKLIFNRRTGCKKFQFADVIVLPSAVIQEMDRIIHLAASGNPEAQKAALALLSQVGDESAKADAENVDDGGQKDG